MSGVIKRYEFKLSVTLVRSASDIILSVRQSQQRTGSIISKFSLDAILSRVRA